MGKVFDYDTLGQAVVSEARGAQKELRKCPGADILNDLLGSTHSQPATKAMSVPMTAYKSRNQLDLKRYSSMPGAVAKTGRVDEAVVNTPKPEVVVPCFTPGTRIATTRGAVLVEELVEGDRVITRDNGFQEVRWIGRKHIVDQAMHMLPKLRPVLIKAGALGQGLPQDDIVVSPNHRILLTGPAIYARYGEREVLVAAKHLIGMPGVQQLPAVRATYLHFMFDRHEVVLSNGAWTESFQPADSTLETVDMPQRRELFALFPELRDQKKRHNYRAARRTISEQMNGIFQPYA